MDTRKVYDTKLLKYRDFQPLRNQHKYDFTKIKNCGYDIDKEGILKRCVSKVMYSDSKMSIFLNYIDRMLVHFIDCIKYIQFYNNFSMKNDDTHINI